MDSTAAYPDISWPLLCGASETNLAPTWFPFPVLAAGFRTFESEFSQNLLRCHISLIAGKTKMWFPPFSRSHRQLAG